MNVRSRHFYQKYGLNKFSDMFVVVLREVLNNRNLLTLAFKRESSHFNVEQNITDDVLSLVTPVSNNALIDELIFTLLLPILASLAFYFLDTLGAAHCTLESKDRIKNQRDAIFDRYSACFKTLHNFEVVLANVDEIRSVEKLWCLADLLIFAAVPKGLLDNNIYEGLVDRVILVVESATQLDSGQLCSINHNSVLVARD